MLNWAIKILSWYCAKTKCKRCRFFKNDECVLTEYTPVDWEIILKGEKEC